VKKSTVSYLLFLSFLVIAIVSGIIYYYSAQESDIKTIEDINKKKFNQISLLRTNCLLSSNSDINKEIRKFEPDIKILNPTTVSELELLRCDKIVVVNAEKEQVEKIIDNGIKPLLVGNFLGNETISYLNSLGVEISNTRDDFIPQYISIDYKGWNCVNAECKEDDISNTLKVIITSSDGYIEKNISINLKKYNYMKIKAMRIISQNTKMTINLDDKVKKVYDFSIFSKDTYSSVLFKWNPINDNASKIRLEFTGENTTFYITNIEIMNGAFLKYDIYFNLFKNINPTIIDKEIDMYTVNDKFYVLYLNFDGSDHPLLITRRNFYYLNILNFKDALSDGNIRQLIINYYKYSN
jgi:hypothetical protein